MGNATVPTNIRQEQSAGWFVAVNPILTNGEMGFEIDTRKFKIGNGTSRYAALPYGTPNAPFVTGAKGGNAALANLITVLAAQGIVTDATT